MFDDRYKAVVKAALKQQGWETISDPFYVYAGKTRLQMDLQIEKEGARKIVEIKSFLSEGFFEDFYGAIGQYLVYKKALASNQIDKDLYLAVPFETYKRHFTKPFVSELVKENNIRLLIFNPKTQRITRWIS